MVRSNSRGKEYKFPPIAIPYSPTETYILIFPRAFTRCLDGKFPKQVHLRDRYYNGWTVRTGELENGAYILKDCWKFIEENFAKPGDVIIFQYDGDNSFNVKIFRLDGCETERVSKGLIRPDEEEPEYDEHEYSTEDEAYEEQHVPSDRRTRMNHLRPDIFESRIFERPKNPYFVTNIYLRRVHELIVPSYIIQMFNLRLPRVIVLCDSTGGEWGAECQRWKSGRQLYVGGWRNICEANSVTEQDLGICEFVRQNGDPCLQIEFARSLA